MYDVSALRIQIRSETPFPPQKSQAFPPLGCGFQRFNGGDWRGLRRRWRPEGSDLSLSQTLAKMLNQGAQKIFYHPPLAGLDFHRHRHTRC